MTSKEQKNDELVVEFFKELGVLLSYDFSRFYGFSQERAEDVVHLPEKYFTDEKIISDIRKFKSIHDSNEV